MNNVAMPPDDPRWSLPDISLFDQNFAHHPNSSSLASYPNFERQPTYFNWVRSEEAFTPKICVFTDNELRKAKTIKSNCNIAWLLEPKELCEGVYQYVLDNKDDFDLILTHDEKFLRELGPKGRYWLYGGTWVKDEDFGIHKKSKSVSMIASWKRQLEGHQLRHVAISLFRGKYGFDAMGNGYRPIAEAIEGLKDYRFSIVIENVKSGIVTEKIMNCFLTGTIPIYWGNACSLARNFNVGGVLSFNDLDELNRHLHNISVDGEQIYDCLKREIEDNFERAKRLYLTEDVLWDNIFKEIYNG